ncbi:RagB/SusD family nutrient uptake outer membrane protein [Phaeodactylibacter sp.]|uniref:RagB/SusD family nutrient uptake outer membrane protein n=1 Tax=Phaeodactylibacter sp. TaxID=1940289 RepID=UPI0025E0B5E5|nr:RagB/SusD family nutrient uptake outer membrane protein [Phaeodactylibacter sp.]MCI4647814.1 RagB/SusD family nutrient uptake outer membrane protein [Phaeodactylibacter sp.]MCI5092050.1 RagB/SusD family nutrient uptake outer membrane protein [Phaeodactylibacter sp.]
MRKIINISLVALVLAMSACTDLDVTPRNDLIPDVFFGEEDAYQRFLARLYAGLAVTGQQGPAGNPDIKTIPDEGFSSYLRQYWQLQTLPTDEAVIGWNDEGLPDIVTQQWGSNNQFVRAMYSRVFFQVSLANEFLRESTPEKLEERGVSEEVRAQMPAFRAEARFLRALSYWHGIDLFRNIPFYTEDQLVGGSAPSQASAADIYTFLVDELQIIEADMLDPGTAPYGRADRAALWMLQAKLYLNAEVYSGRAAYNECVEACNKIIESGTYSLAENYQHNFLADNHTSPEIIFAVNFDGEATQTFGGTTYLVHAALGGAMTDTEYGVSGAWGGLRTTPSLVDLYPDETGNIDERAIFFTEGQTKAIEALDEFTNGYASPKYQNITSDGVAGSSVTFVDTDYPLFRFADVHLMYAEAVLRGATNGDLATATTLINQLRLRAYDNEAGNISEADLNLDFILDERARELYWEGHRRTDLIRFGKYTEEGVWAWKGGIAEGQTTAEFRNLYPIPAEELLANPSLDQNPGY